MCNHQNHQRLYEQVGLTMPEQSDASDDITLLVALLSHVGQERAAHLVIEWFHGDNEDIRAPGRPAI